MPRPLPHCSYFIAFLAVCWYNYSKLRAMRASAPAPLGDAEGGTAVEASALLRRKSGESP